MWLLLSCVFSPAAARADSPGDAAASTKAVKEEARAHYARGVQLYTDGASGAALVELERAYKLAPSFKILFSIGLVQLRLADYAGAKTSFEGYLADGGAEVPAARKTEVEERLADLAQRVATVAVTVNEPGADVLVDDIRIGTAPLAKPVPLNPGYHKISASKDGFTGQTKQVGFVGGDRQEMALQLTPIAPVATPTPASEPAATYPLEPVTVAPAPAPAPDEAPRVAKPLWIGWAATGVLAAGAVATGVLALNQSSKVASEVTQQPIAPGEISSTHQKTVTLAAVTDVLAGAALVVGGVTLYLTLTAKGGTAHAAKLYVGPGSAGLRGSF